MHKPLLHGFFLVSFLLFACPMMALTEEEKAFIEYAKAGNLDGVQGAVANGININAQNEDGQTALHWAAWKSHEKIVDYLLLRNADTTIQSHKGHDAAFLCENKKIKQMLNNASWRINSRRIVSSLPPTSVGLVSAFSFLITFFYDSLAAVSKQ